MDARLKLKFAAACAALLLVALCAAAAQTRRQPRQPSRRVTNPVTGQATPTPEEPRVVSTAEEPQDDPGAARRSRAARRPTPQPPDDGAATRKAVEDLTGEMTRLNKKVDDMERQRRVDLIMERLTRAEQRAEAVQSQLRDTLEKDTNLQARVEQLDDAMRPDSLNRQVALIGSFRPDEERDRLRRQYENEKARVQSLIDVNDKQRARLEASLASADQLVQRLRSQLDDETRRELEAEAAAGREGESVTPARLPTPRPTPTEPPPPGL
jgi:DNA repair exonuclease SbcCD ATPase subunit